MLVLHSLSPLVSKKMNIKTLRCSRLDAQHFGVSLTSPNSLAGAELTWTAGPGQRLCLGLLHQVPATPPASGGGRGKPAKVRGSGGTPARGTNCPPPNARGTLHRHLPKKFTSSPNPPPKHLEDKRGRPGQLCAEPWPGCLRQGSWLTMTNPIQVASVERGDFSRGLRGSPGSHAQRNTAPREGLGPGLGSRLEARPPLRVSVSLHFIPLPRQPGPGAKHGFPMAPTSESPLGHSQSPLCCLFILNSLIFHDRDADWLRLGQRSCHGGRDTHCTHFGVPLPQMEGFL